MSPPQTAAVALIEETELVVITGNPGKVIVTKSKDELQIPVIVHFKEYEVPGVPEKVDADELTFEKTPLLPLTIDHCPISPVEGKFAAKVVFNVLII
jgi:hypothetical protein